MEVNYATRVAVKFEVELGSVELRLEDLAQPFARHYAKDNSGRKPQGVPEARGWLSERKKGYWRRCVDENAASR